MRLVLRRAQHAGATSAAAGAYVVLRVSGAANPASLGRGAAGHIYLMRVLLQVDPTDSNSGVPLVQFFLQGFL